MACSSFYTKDEYDEHQETNWDADAAWRAAERSKKDVWVPCAMCACGACALGLPPRYKPVS